MFQNIETLVLDFTSPVLHIEQPRYVIKDQQLQWLDNSVPISEFCINMIQLRQARHQSLGCLNLFNQTFNLTIFGQKKEILFWFNYLKLYCFQQCVFKNYKIIQLLGQGGFGKVYEVEDTRTHTKYAMKVLRHKQQEKYIIKEIEILRQLNHETCIKLHEIYKDSTSIYLLIDYIGCGELLIYLQKHKYLLDELQIRDIMQMLFEGLEYIHSKGIIHRDIKAQNILIRSKDNILDLVYSDFGLADFYNKDGKYQTKYCGTPGFMAPEMINNEPYDYKVDVYSLGVLLYLIITDLYPYESESTEEDIKNLSTNSIEKQLKDNNFSNEGIDFIKQCLAIDPNKRLTSKEALRHVWFRITNRQTQFSINFTTRNFTKTMMKTKTLMKTKTAMKEKTNIVLNNSNDVDLDDAEMDLDFYVHNHVLYPKFMK